MKIWIIHSRVVSNNSTSEADAIEADEVGRVVGNVTSVTDVGVRVETRLLVIMEEDVGEGEGERVERDREEDSEQDCVSLVMAVGSVASCEAEGHTPHWNIGSSRLKEESRLQNK